MSSVIPQTNPDMPIIDPKVFNASQGELKLGPAPVSDELRAETDRVLRESAMVNPDAQFDLHFARPAPPAGLVSPSSSDLPPYPPSFKTEDVKREVEKVRDARKRIRLDPVPASNGFPGTAKSRALPSICAYTLQDVGEGYV